MDRGIELETVPSSSEQTIQRALSPADRNVQSSLSSDGAAKALEDAESAAANGTEDLSIPSRKARLQASKTQTERPSSSDAARIKARNLSMADLPSDTESSARGRRV